MGIKDGSGGANGGAGGDDEIENDDIDAGGDDGEKTVSRSTYNKTVTQAKNARERARVEKERADKLEQEKLVAQGDKDGEIKTLRQQLAEKDKSHLKLQQTVVKKALNAQVTAAAVKAGCTRPDKLVRLIDFSALGDVDADTLEADSELVDSAIAALKKDVPEFFSKPGPKINNKSPSGKITEDEPEKEDLSKLKPDELRARLRALDRMK